MTSYRLSGDIMKKILAVMAIALLIVLSNTAGAVSIKDVTDTISLEENYKLRLVSIDASGPVRSATLDLNPGDKITILDDENFSIYRKDILVAEGRLDAVFIGHISEMIQIKDLVQYDEEGTIILTLERVVLVKPYHPPFKITHALDTFKLKQGYDLVLMAADEKAIPQQIWLKLSHNGETVDDVVVPLGETFNMYDGDALIFTSTFDQIFQGSQSMIVELNALSQYNRNTGALILYQDKVLMEFP